MPIKNGLYDMLGYSKQITEITRSYRRENKDEGENGELIIQDGTLKIKLTSEEFLSGIRFGVNTNTKRPRGHVAR